MVLMMGSEQIKSIFLKLFNYSQFRTYLVLIIFLDKILNLILSSISIKCRDIIFTNNIWQFGVIQLAQGYEKRDEIYGFTSELQRRSITSKNEQELSLLILKSFSTKVGRAVTLSN